MAGTDILYQRMHACAIIFVADVHNTAKLAMVRYKDADMKLPTED